MQAALQHIIADFSRLGRHGPGHENEIDLGTDDAPNLAGHTLQDGEPAIFYEPGSLEAPGTLCSVVEDDGRRWWIARIDLTAMHSVQDTAETTTA